MSSSMHPTNDSVVQLCQIAAASFQDMPPVDTAAVVHQALGSLPTLFSSKDSDDNDLMRFPNLFLSGMQWISCIRTDKSVKTFAVNRSHISSLRSKKEPTSRLLL